MKKFLQHHGLAAVIWAVLVILAVVFMPDVNALVRDHGAVKLPNNVESQVASRIEKKANNNRKVSTYTAVFNGRHALTKAQSKRIDRKLKALHSEKGLTITTVMRPSANAETKKQLISGDKTTQLAQITVKKGPLIKTQVTKLQAQLKTAGLKTYVTGVDALNDDFSTVTEQGIKKTEVIAIIFIFIVLILVFRSPIVPLISLLNVGVAFIVSLSVVMNLAAHAGFPISNFTQVFMVVVLFGIGTDYDILLYDYFKGQLAAGRSALEATKETRRHGGRTVLYSGVSVLIGFSVLWLAKFSFYQSASAVAIGVLVLLPVLLTLNMFFMATLGAKMFWPSRVDGGESSSKLWYWLARSSMRKPALWLAAIAVLAVPMTMLMNAEENFNNADELPTTYQSKKGYVTIQKHFSKGMTAPATIYIQSQGKLNTQSKLAAIDQLTQYLQKEPGVKTVASVTEPGGSRIDAMYLHSQLKTITDGLAESQKGLATLKSGLANANTQLKQQNVSGSVAQVQTLANGSQQLATKMATLQAGLKTYTAGVSTVNSGEQTLKNSTGALVSGTQKLTSGADQLNSGAKTINANMATLASGAKQVSGGTATMNAKVQQLRSAGNQLNSSLNGLYKELTAMNTQAESLLASLNQQLGGTQPGLLQTAVSGIQSGLTQVNQGLNSASGQINTAADQVNTLAGGAAKVASGASAMTAGTKTLSSGTQALAANMAILNSGAGQAVSGIDQLAAGTAKLNAQNSTLNSGTAALTSGAGQVNAGVQEVNTKLKAMATQVNKLSDGLTSATDALGALEKGNQSMSAYLIELEGSYMGNQFYLPKATIKSSAFKPALDAYMYDHDHITELTLVFKGDPNSATADQHFTTLQNDLKAQLKHGALRQAKVAIGGQTSQDHDLRKLANGDFLRTASIMVIGIFIALVFVTESLLQPLTILATLVTAYVTSMGLTRLISSTVLGRPLLSWNTPFFTFIMLMALGVDYSIFLMVRFKDGKMEHDVRVRMLKAATTIGAVVLSAAVILGGTFAALMPSGVTTLIQVAIGVIVGLVLLVILLPIAMSALISLNEWHHAREMGQADNNA